MHDPFDGRQYLIHLRSRWRLPAVVLTVALAAALGASLLVPQKFTARVTLVIDPPAGSDVRASTAVSPVYLESLRTYEHLASSDSLFAQAAARFGLRGDGSPPFEKLKREVLRVSILRNTKVMEIAATLPDPRRAHDVALYLAEETVKLNRRTNRAGDDELIARARKDVEEAARRLAAAEAASGDARKRGASPESLRAELNRIKEMRVEVAQLALAAELAASDLEQRERQLQAAGGGAELEGVRSRLESLRNRAGRLRREESELERRGVTVEKSLAGREVEVDAADAEADAARAFRERAEKSLFEIQSMSGLRGERLSLMDPGVPPERPSSPNIPLNLFVAGALGLLLSLLYLTAEYGLQPAPLETVAEPRWMATRT